MACAHYLRSAGCQVTLIDQGRAGEGCSRSNCGYICPSHALPLAGPGVLLPTLLTLFRKSSPLAVRLSAGPALWAWLVRFALRCNRRDQLATAHALHPLLQSSRRLYDEMFASGALEADRLDAGLLFVFQSRRGLDHYGPTDRLLRRELGLAATRYEGEALQALEPSLSPSVAGAYHYPCDMQVRPERLVASWRARLLADGVELREGAAFTSFQQHRADAYVFATGAWTPRLAGLLGCSLPIQPGKGYSLTWPRPSPCPRHPMIFEEHRVAVSPFSDGLRIGSTMELGGYDESMSASRLELLTSAARQYLREPPAGPPGERWWGWRPMTPDGLPVIGPVPRRRGVWVAAGHGMLGVTLAAATGKLVSEMVLGQPPHIDPHPYRATRF
jgi:D-amino-acid dehydrogenase